MTSSPHHINPKRSVSEEKKAKKQLINQKGKIKRKEDVRTNTIWFSEKFLLKNGFKSEFMLKILTAIFFNKVEIPVIGVLLYDYLSKKI